MCMLHLSLPVLFLQTIIVCVKRMEIRINAYDLIERSFASSRLPHTNELNITGHITQYVRITQYNLPTLAMCPGDSQSPPLLQIV